MVDYNENEEAPIENYVNEPNALYIANSFQKNIVLSRIAQSINSKKLFSNLINTTGLTIQHLAQFVFEMTPKTFIKYKNTEVTVPSRIAEIAIEIDALYQLGNELFGTNKAFNAWLEKENSFFDNKAPIAFLNTSSGISLIYEELKAIEFGTTA